MNKSFALPILAIVFASCTGGSQTPAPKPYRFDRDRLDKMVKNNTAIYDSRSRDGRIVQETYYLGDTARYRILYDSRNNISEVYRFDLHGQIQWQENYYPNGQRKAHFPKKPAQNMETGVYDGYYETYYENGAIQAVGVYKNDQLIWTLPYDKEGVAGDTTRYEYAEPKAEAPKTKDSVSTGPKKIKVEKIGTATTPN